MHNTHSDKETILTVLSSSYSPVQLRDFVQLSYALALPFIRGKIRRGKLNLDVIGLQENDLVHDCIADLFQQDERGGFPQMRRFFETHLGEVEDATEEELISTLRYLVFAKVNTNIIRLYSEEDPTLAKILRNLGLALQRTQLFEQTVRFGETHLIPRGTDPLLCFPPISMDLLEQELCRVACLHDKIPDMVQRLCSVLTSQEEYQRSVPLISVALMFKRVYSYRWMPDEQMETVGDDNTDRVQSIVEEVWEAVNKYFFKVYVESGKQSEQMFNCHMRAIRNILSSHAGIYALDGKSYYDYLKVYIPDLDKAAYRSEHRVVLEHIAQTAKTRLAEALRDFRKKEEG